MSDIVERLQHRAKATDLDTRFPTISGDRTATNDYYSIGPVGLDNEAIAEITHLRDEVSRLRAERIALQRRIKNQRKALREQHKSLQLYSHRVQELIAKQSFVRVNAYSHAARLAETARRWSFGWQIARVIRRWI